MEARVSQPTPTPTAHPPTGVWLIGARGSVATTTVAGCAALAAALQPPTALVTAAPAFADSGLPPLSRLVFGGHDTAATPLPKRAEDLAAQGVLPAWLPAAVHGDLAAADDRIRPGAPAGDPRADDAVIDALAADITAFTRTAGAARTVVINVASTEPAPTGDALPPSSLYAAAALRAGCAYVNFTPSAG
ncbi:inositol-3-phosphate synthase, partial [Streptomyces sp. NPDC088785]|uniref:inositol-3-phosphate synthase n=1 Tax=Streptomyces sp. NPDC088785 TaxID=3365897 RepID=UPI003826453D